MVRAAGSGLVGALQHAEEMLVVAGLEGRQPDSAMCRFRKRVDPVQKLS